MEGRTLARLVLLVVAAVVPLFLVHMLFGPGSGGMRGGKHGGLCPGRPHKVLTAEDLDLTVFAHPYRDPAMDFLRGRVLPKETPFSNYYHFYRQVVCNGTDPCHGLALDLGAYLGPHALFLARLGLEVHAFEPWEPSAALLACSRAASKLDNLTVVNKAVTNAVGRACMLQPRPEHQALTALIPKPVERCRNITVVETTTLDSYWDTVLGKRQVDLLKIDVEGTEYHVLDGAREMLVERPPRYVLLEYHPKLMALKKVDVRMLLSIVFSSNYRLYECQFSKELRQGPAAVKALEAYKQSGLVTDLLLVRKADYKGQALPKFQCSYNAGPEGIHLRRRLR